MLEMAEALDAMERSVSSWEADFLESTLVRLREGRALSEKQEAKLKELYEKYLGLEAEDSDGADEDDFA